MTIQVGERIPAASLNVITSDGVQAITTEEIFAGRKVVLFSVPGAFTPTCSTKHLPGYVEKFPEFQARGIDVACMAVNDAYVMKAWARDQTVPEGMIMLADGNANLARALGLAVDGSTTGPSLRAGCFRGGGSWPSAARPSVARWHQGTAAA